MRGVTSVWMALLWSRRTHSLLRTSLIGYPIRNPQRESNTEAPQEPGGALSLPIRFPVGRDGKVLLTPDGLHDPVGEYLQRAVRSSFVDGEPRIVDLHRDPSGGDPHITVIAPLFLDSRSQGKPLGAVIMVHEAREFLFPLIRSWPTASETAETLLVRREGDEVLFLNDLRHRKDTALKFSVPLSRAESLAVQGVLGERGVVEGIDYRGEEVLAVVEEIPDSPWIIVTKMDTEEAFAAWRLRSGMILALLLVFVVLVGVGALVMSQRNT